MTVAIDQPKKKKRDEDALLLFWQAHTSPAFAGILTGDGWKWSEADQNYVSATGTKFKSDDLKNLALLFISSVELQMEVDAKYLTDEELRGDDYEKAVNAWQQQQQETLDDELTLLAALAVGGFDEMLDEDRATVQGMEPTDENEGSGLSGQFYYLQRFADELKNREAGTPKQIIARAGSYADSGWPVYQAVAGDSHGRATDDKGRKLFLFERSVLGPNENHCYNSKHAEGCIEASEAKWQSIGTLPKIGGRTCGQNCHALGLLQTPAIR